MNEPPKIYHPDTELSREIVEKIADSVKHGNVEIEPVDYCLDCGAEYAGFHACQNPREDVDE